MSISCSVGPSWAARPHWLTGTSKRSTIAPLPGSPVLCLCTLVAWLCPFHLGSSSRVPLKFSCDSGLVFLWVCVCSYAQSCLTLFNLRDCSPLGSSVHGISQARILEWVAIFFSRGSSRCRIEPVLRAFQVDSLPLSHLGSTHMIHSIRQTGWWNPLFRTLQQNTL